eukprot:TRINITY_DN99015_c0_g1_i1.p1 TRINITY_DN99015_c0_g1~~TRINITY_DN99015_c0_g1_i1.p1  ORF type:complete len:241 (+),score=30.44 TRINITY_DN99015_c0_g1_i1:27-725(+)
MDAGEKASELQQSAALEHRHSELLSDAPPSFGQAVANTLSSKETCYCCNASLGKRHLTPRHRCQFCDASVCGTCSQSTVQSSKSGELMRACKNCVVIVGKQTEMVRRIDLLSRQLYSHTGTRSILIPDDSENIEEALTRVEALLQPLDDERMYLMGQVEEAVSEAQQARSKMERLQRQASAKMSSVQGVSVCSGNASQTSTFVTVTPGSNLEAPGDDQRQQCCVKRDACVLQ